MKQLNALIFIFLMLFSMIGKSIEVHYCNGEITDTAVFGSINCCCINDLPIEELEECHGPNEDHCHPVNDGHAEHDPAVEDDCCSTAVVEIYQSIDLDHSNGQTVQPIIVLTTLLNPYLFIAEISENTTTYYYNSPIHCLDRSVEYQTFLI